MIFMDRILERPIEKVGFCCLKILDTVFADDIVLLASLNRDFKIQVLYYYLFLELSMKLNSEDCKVKVWEHCPWKSFPAKKRNILKKDFFGEGCSNTDKIPERRVKDKMCL